MANEDKKDFNAMLMDSKDMPRVQIITDEKSIEKYGGDKMYFAPPIDYDKVMRLVPCGIAKEAKASDDPKAKILVKAGMVMIAITEGLLLFSDILDYRKSRIEEKLEK